MRSLLQQQFGNALRILFDPHPRNLEEIFSPQDAAKFLSEHEVVTVEPVERDLTYAETLPGIEILVSQQPMDRARLDSASRLRAIFNVETNFLPNIDYERCFQRGIHVLSPMSVFAVPVAEMGLGMALSLARGIHTGHGDFRSGREKYGLAGNADAELLSNADIGLVGFGNLGQALNRLLEGFRPRIRVFDPWIPSGHLERLGVTPASLQEVLAESRVVFVVASVTTDNAHFLNRDTLCRMQQGAMLVLLSRAAVADFSALADLARSGRIRVATDVFPDEPVPADDPIRETPNMLFSAHRAGGLSGALRQIGALVLEDIDLISRGLPPMSCTRAQRETIAMMRSKPIEAA